MIRSASRQGDACLSKNFERSDPIPAARVAQRFIYGRHYVTQNLKKTKFSNSQILDLGYLNDFRVDF